MADVHDSLTRSKNMRAVKASHTKPEMLFRRALHAEGYRFRLHKLDLPGKPDIVLPKHRVAVFVNGCFWHKHECELFKWPQTRRSWWKDKLEKTNERDKRKHEELIQSDWRVFVVWECALRGKHRISPAIAVSKFTSWLNGIERLGELSSKIIESTAQET